MTMMMMMVKIMMITMMMMRVINGYDDYKEKDEDN